MVGLKKKARAAAKQKSPPTNPTERQQAIHARRHPAEDGPKPGHVLVKVAYNDPHSGGRSTRERNIRADIAELFTDGGVDVAKFAALTPQQQWDACQNDDDVRNAFIG